MRTPAPGAQNLAANLDALAANGHTYLDIPAQVALASGGQSPDATLAIANKIKSSIQSNAAIVDHYYADAQQNRPPTVVQQITTNLHHLVGPKITMEDHVTPIQQQMQKAGYGTGLPINGVWTPEWQDALVKAQNAKFGAPGKGNVDSKNAVQHVLSFLQPSPVANFLINVVKSLPRDTLQMMGDAVSGTADIFTNPFTKDGRVSHSALGLRIGKDISTFGAKKENALTTEQFKAQRDNPLQSLQDLGTLLAYLPMGRLAAGTAKTGSEALGKGLLTVQPLADVAPKYTLLNSIVASAKTGMPSIIQPSARALINKPILGWLYGGLNKILPPILDRLSPAIAKTAPIQMAVRDLIAQRLRIPAIQATNKIGILATGAAVKEGAIALAESKTGGRQGPLDSTVYGLGPISGPLATALDIWGMQMNPGRMGSSEVLGHTGATADALRQSFLDSGALHAWSRANPTLDYGALVAKYGEEAVHQHIGDQLNQIALQHAADYKLNPIKADPQGWAQMTGPEKEDLLLKTKQEIWRNSAPADSDLNQSYQHLIASMNDMETGFRNIALDAAETTKTAGKADKANFAQGITRTGQKIEANQVMGELLAKYPQYIIHPGTLQELKSQLAAHADNARLAEADAIHEPVAPDVIPASDPKILTEAQATFTKTEAASKDAEANFNHIKQLVDEGSANKSDLRRAHSAWSQAAKEHGASARAVSDAQKAVDDAVKNVAQRGRATAPVISIPKPKTNAGWMEANNPAAPDGMLGLMRKEGLTAQENKKLVAKFRAQLANADTPALQDAVRHDVAASLLGDHGLDIYKLGEHSTDELINVLEDQSDKVAHNVYLAKDAPQEAKDLIAKLDSLGYKPVAGQDIGHVFTPGLQRTIEGGYKQTRAAKFASKVGLSPNVSDSKAVSARTSVETMHEIQARIDSGKIDVLPGFNASRTMAWLRDQLPNYVELTGGQEAALGMGKRMGNYDLKIAELMKADSTLTPDTAWAKIQSAKKNELGLREIKPAQLKAALMAKIPDATAELMGLPHGTSFLDEKSADQFIQALWQARLKVPSEMIGGLAKAEDWAYAGFGIGNKSIPGTGLISQVPSRLANIRNRWRFQLSPIFAYRRMFKTMAKGITENIPPTMYPEAKLAEMGISAEADKIYQRVFPEYNQKNAFLDDAERVVAEADLPNLYSPRDFYRWGSYWLSKQGYSDAEIAQKMENVMNYGSRSAAERSLNAVFYPFSFNKTVMRQFGGFLLTHPGQRALLSSLMDQYDKHHGPDMLKWFEDHTPLIKQFERLNALEHGLGLGQLGGINTPYFQGLYHFLTMLGPKKIDYGASHQNDSTLTTLKQYIPALTEFADLFLTNKNGIKIGGQVGGTFGNLYDQAGVALDKLVKHTPETDWSPNRHSSMSYSMQQSEAWAYRTRMITMLSKVLDYNYANPNDRKVWPSWIPQETGLWGKPITKSSIGELVHYKYPQWDNAQSAVIAQRKATEADRFIGEVSAKNASLGATYRLFDEKAKSLSDAVGRDSVKPDQLAVITDAFRGVAIELAKQDSNFADFYKTHYQRLFGPLEVFK